MNCSVIVFGSRHFFFFFRNDSEKSEWLPFVVTCKLFVGLLARDADCQFPMTMSYVISHLGIPYLDGLSFDLYVVTRPMKAPNSGFIAKVLSLNQS